MAAPTPDFSIIVPTYRRRDALARCVRAIEQLDFPRDRFELLVVDDGSPDPPADVIASVAPAIDVQLVCGRHAGPAAARNAGATLARGHTLVFTDDDCAPQPDWLRAIDRATSRSTRPVAIGGRTINVLADDLFAHASQGIVDFLYDYYGGTASPGHFFATNNLAVPRAEFLELGGFDEGFLLAAAEDRDLCERWQAAGWELRYEPDAVVNHAHALGFRGFNRQHFNYGRGAFDLHRSRARRGHEALRLEPVRFYRELITHPVRRSGGWRALSLSALHLWSQVVYASGYFTERARRGWRVSARSDAHPPAERRLPDRRGMRTPARTPAVLELFDEA